MKLIVGLGNIGPQYTGTRHNTGFMVVEEFAKQHNIQIITRKMDAKYGEGFIGSEKVMVVEPTTFMNESGRAVVAFQNYFDIDVDDIIIIHDDMDLPVGKIRIRATGSAGGHNGIKSIIASIGTRDFARIKVGIAHPQRQKVVDYVLGKFSKEQLPDFLSAQDHAVSALEDWVDGSAIPELENKFN
ncbi:aminoacyl-tRNA hydrolase [Lentilactobacillus sp. SPB1-3]|uniref:Aminoacyl-tRNA hydrolase n=1 Tax=Lentilactobacillus terminaliae TaxID=3003483 RepID=A0ACD5DGV1_9LACO|nr:aminoacyl-tRNA hydrolase [Lentilactobacillus sp. SPB1-3]MCZ0977912.1 aminoacyl-tRNA hydrolase [Lentilactobacillus sp. SPB1-3]